MGSVWCTLHMEDSSFQRKSVILVVPALLPLQPSQSSSSSETCQLISYRSKGFADSHCHATLFLHRSRMHGSNTGGKLTCAPGLHKFLFSRERGFLQRKRWDLVTVLPPGVLLTAAASSFSHSHGYLPAAEGRGHLQELCAEVVLRPRDQELRPLLVRRLWRQ